MTTLTRPDDNGRARRGPAAGVARPRPRAARALAAGAAALLLASVWVTTAAAHGPDPALSGGGWAQNQDLRFYWRSGAAPTAVFRTAIANAANDVNASRASKAATFTLDAAATNLIGYGPGATCGVNGLACFTRTLPTGFTMWLREQGHVFDWGTLKWCQAYTTPPNGCYDAETIAVDEFGHIEGLGHHVNYADDSDYLDANVQTFSRTKPNTGWNVHQLARCDTARLQMLYDMLTWTAKYSTCLDLATDLTVAASTTTVLSGASTTLTATLKVVDVDAYGRLGGNPVSGRTVTLQRRAPGAAAWSTVGTMPGGTTSGTYVLSQRPTADTEYRAVFGTPSTEGINGDTSAALRIYVSTCGSSVARVQMTAAIQVPCL